MCTTCPCVLCSYVHSTSFCFWNRVLNAYLCAISAHYICWLYTVLHWDCENGTCVVFMRVFVCLQPIRAEWQWCCLCWRWSGFWAPARTKTSPGTAQRAASSWGRIAPRPGFQDYSILYCPHHPPSSPPGLFVVLICWLLRSVNLTAKLPAKWSGVDQVRSDEPSLVRWTVKNLCLFIMTTQSILRPQQHKTGQLILASS